MINPGALCNWITSCTLPSAQIIAECKMLTDNCSLAEVVTVLSIFISLAAICVNLVRNSMKVKIQKDFFFLENILCNCRYTVNRLSDIVMLRSSDWQIGLQIFQTKHCPTRLFTDLFFSSGVVRLRLYWIYYIYIDKKSNGNPVGAIRTEYGVW